MGTSQVVFFWVELPFVTPESTAMLTAFWSWVGGVGSVLLIGVLAPATLAAAFGFLPLIVARRDARTFLPLLLLGFLFDGCGTVTLLAIRAGAPLWDFWLMLAVEVGMIVGVSCFGWCLLFSIRRLRQSKAELASVRAFRPEQVASHEALAPAPRKRLSAFEAEYYVAEWMRSLGATEAVVTPSRRDGGVDVRSGHYVAQVKHRPQDFVGVEVVRALSGVAALEGRKALFFTSGRYSSDALAYANRAGVALFIFRPAESRLIAANALGLRLRQSGLEPIRAEVATSRVRESTRA